MHSRRMFKRLSGASLASCVTLSLWAGIAGAAESQVSQSSPPSQDGPIEQIEITGRATRLQLRVEIEKTEIQMFSMFNKLNDAREFDVRCQEVMITGSRIAERECVPIYMKRARMNAFQQYLFTDLTPAPPPDGSGAYTPKLGDGISMDRRGAPEAEAQVWFQNNPKHKAFNAKFRELAAQHPELAAAALELQAKRQRLIELEERQRNDGALGRLFSGSSDSDEEP